MKLTLLIFICLLAVMFFALDVDSQQYLFPPKPVDPSIRYLFLANPSDDLGVFFIESSGDLIHWHYFAQISGSNRVPVCTSASNHQFFRLCL